MIPDGDANANPRGLALRFALAEHVHTDIVSHSTDGFPARTGQEFLDFLRAAAQSQSSPGTIEAFLGSHPAALAFVQTPKPAPSSFAREEHFGVNAMRFTNSEGLTRYGRYRIKPEAGVEHLTGEAAGGQDPNYLFNEISGRLAKGPIGFEIWVQVAQDGDVTDDATVHWPEDRKLVHLGGVRLTGVMDQNPQQQKAIIFDPIPRVDGIEPSDDPLLELRAAIYLLSGRRRRQAAAGAS
jgi:catalase